MERAHNILIVEDNLGDFELIDDFIAEQLNSHQITHATSYKQAETMLKATNNSFTIVLLDLSLPDHSGEKLIHDVMSLCKNIPVVVLTGYTDFAFGVKSLSMGVADYLLKEDLNGTLLLKSIVYSTERKKISTALEESEKRIRNFANQLNNALEDERSHIAREIHDEFGQQLAGLKMSLSTLKRQVGMPNATIDIVNSLMADVNVSIEMVRRIANELRPVLIDKLGLFVALEWLVSEFEKKTGIKSQIEITSLQTQFNKNVEINIFRICQEALTNIAKHANASAVAVHITDLKNQFLVSINDNGTGMEPNILINPLSMGLSNMKERSKLIDGHLAIKSNPKEGTTIELIVKSHDKENISSR